MKHTPWFPASVKPVRAGVYEVKEGRLPVWYRYWDGQFWYAGGPSPWSARNWILMPIGVKEAGRLLAAPWRGLAEEPK
jgi:hypothetical protein